GLQNRRLGVRFPPALLGAVPHSALARVCRRSEEKRKVPVMAMNREQKRMMQRQGQLGADGAPIPQPKTQPRAQKGPKEPRTSPSQFVREVRGELRKVAWPSREEVVKYSIIVFVTIVVMTALIAALDFAFGETIFWIIDR